MNYKTINTDYLETVTGGDKEILIEIIGIFRNQAEEIVAEMRLLYEKKDYFNLGLLAHKAKSSVAIMGMSDLALMLKKLELEGKEGRNPENYMSCIERYAGDTKHALIELDDYVSNL